jgi:AAT family amino acid transporter
LTAARLFGEAEFWFAMIKIVAIVALIVTGIFMMVGHHPTPLGQASIGNLFHNYQLFPHGMANFHFSFSDGLLRLSRALNLSALRLVKPRIRIA